MARIDHLAPFMHQPLRQYDGPLRTRPEGVCVGCQTFIDRISNYNPIEAVSPAGDLFCSFCCIQLRQAEYAGWSEALHMPDTHWNPWPPDEEQLAFVWDGHTYVDCRTVYEGPRR